MYNIFIEDAVDDKVGSTYPVSITIMIHTVVLSMFVDSFKSHDETIDQDKHLTSLNYYVYDSNLPIIRTFVPKKNNIKCKRFI